MFKSILCASVVTILSTSVCYGASIITSDGIKNDINLVESSVISAKNGENIISIKNLPSIFGIAFNNDTYVTTKFAKVMLKNLENTPVYKSSNGKEIVGNIQNGAMVVVYGETNGYSEIFFNEEKAYIPNEALISSGFLSPANAIEQNIQKYGIVEHKDGVHIKTSTKNDAKILGYIGEGTHIDIIATEDKYLKIKYNDIIGYVQKDKIKLTDKKENVVQEDNKKPIKENSENIEQNTQKSVADEIIDYAKQFLGKPYIYGGTNLSQGTDCSGFTFSIYKEFGISLNRISRDQYLNGTSIQKDELKKGDLMFFNTGDNTPISHVGIYMGDRKYIHSTPTNNKGVMISSIDEDYAVKTYYGSKRVLK